MQKINKKLNDSVNQGRSANSGCASCYLTKCDGPTDSPSYMCGAHPKMSEDASLGYLQALLYSIPLLYEVLGKGRRMRRGSGRGG